MRPVDHAEASSHFIDAKAHLEFHDRRLWDLRLKRDREAHGIPEWEQLRDLASAIKEHTLSHLADYLEEFEAQAKNNGAQVHWARDASEHNQIVYDILSAHGAKTLVKSKSMLTEECDMRPFLETARRQGDRDRSWRTHSAARRRAAELTSWSPRSTSCAATFRKCSPERSGRSPATTTRATSPKRCAATRDRIFCGAEAGMTGANFAVAETGSFVVCTNEGNADLSANVPKLHIASIGIEKIIPKIEHLAVFIRMLSRSALGSPITQYTSHFRAPRPGTELHIVLVDNGRSQRLGMKDFWHSLKCIRCGACMNTCPVYRRSGGLSYGATYSGPIGIIIDPAFDIRKYSNLPFASTLNGSCTNVCPVKIDIHDQIYKWRQVMAERNQLPLVKKEAIRVIGKVMSEPRLYRAAISATGLAIEHLPRFAIYNWLNPWGRQREVPEPPKQSFRSWYIENRTRQ